MKSLQSIVKNAAVLGVAALLLTHCAGGGLAGSPSVVPAGSVSSGADRSAQSVSNLSTLPILTDTSTAKTGVFVGEDCGPNAIVPCFGFANAFRHGAAVGNYYAGWDFDLGNFAAAQNFSALWASGTEPMITWQPHSSKSAITYADLVAGTYDAYIQTSAKELHALGFPVMLRPFHEFNGTWYSWGLANQGADAAADTQFIAAWRHVVNIFRQNGATNVKFVWCYNNASVPNATANPWNNPAHAYPGDTYVDWIATDAYNRGSSAVGKWYTFDQVVSQAYGLAVSISTVKPVMLGELASNEYGDGGSMKATWISQMLGELQQPASTNRYPHLRALLWFQSDTNGYSYDNESTSPAYTAWVKGLRTLDGAGVLNFRSNAAVFSSLSTP